MSSELPRNIALVGFMGSGKSTVGRTLAGMLAGGWRYVDTDHLIERRANCSIPALFEAQGEVVFRGYEEDAVQGVCAGERQVIATGGGAVLREANVVALRHAGLVVWLTARPDVVVARTRRRWESRPLLSPGSDDPLAHVLRLLGERGPLYQAAAHIVVDTSDRAPDTIAREVCRRAERWTAAGEESQSLAG